MRSPQGSRTSLCLCSLLSSTLFACLLFVPTAAVSALTPAATPVSSSQPNPARNAQAVASYAKLPLSFETNQGQTELPGEGTLHLFDYTDGGNPYGLVQATDGNSYGTTEAVTISDNAPDSPQMVSLTGIGVGGKVKLR